MLNLLGFGEVKHTIIIPTAVVMKANAKARAVIILDEQMCNQNVFLIIININYIVMLMGKR